MKRKQGLTLFILARILPPLALLMAGISWFGINHIQRNTVDQKREHLSHQTARVEQVEAERLQGISAQAQLLSRNDFIIGSLVDAHLRREGLPIFFQSLYLKKQKNY